MQFNQQKPIYLQIADYMQDQILSGTWPDGNRIPSIRDLAIEMEVNPNTATRTYNHLQEQGIISMQRGIGYFTSDNASTEVKKVKKEEFIHTTLPEVFHIMGRVNVTIKELTDLYREFRQKEYTP
jgi:GntR family transcriptional regulator